MLWKKHGKEPVLAKKDDFSRIFMNYSYFFTVSFDKETREYDIIKSMWNKKFFLQVTEKTRLNIGGNKSEEKRKNCTVLAGGCFFADGLYVF